jgi:hypothetical protein
MPKASRHKRVSHSLKVGVAYMEKLHFKQRYNYSTAVSVGTSMKSFQLTPSSFGPRLVAISDCFMFFRFCGMRVRLLPYQSILSAVFSDNLTAVAYMPGRVTTSPTAYADLVEMENVEILSANQTVPVDLKLPTSELKGDDVCEWYSTRVGNVTDALFFQQGIIYIASTGATTSNTMGIQFTFDVEFSGPVWTGLTSSLPSHLLINQDEKQSEHVDSQVTPETPLRSWMVIPETNVNISRPTVPTGVQSHPFSRMGSQG